MTTTNFAIILIAMATITSNKFCMEPEGKEEGLKQMLVFRTDGNYKKLTNFLKKHSVDSIDSSLQYKMLKACILFNNMDCLKICLDHKFNPNRYHKCLSLLHYAVQRNNPQAIQLLANANADLIPYHNTDNIPFESDPDLITLKTPLDYARDLKHQKCGDALFDCMKQKLLNLFFDNAHCGLSKHILKSGRCDECISALTQQLRWHTGYFYSDPEFLTTHNFNNSITDISSYSESSSYTSSYSQS
jgi:hypothetical protein